MASAPSSPQAASPAPVGAGSVAVATAAHTGPMLPAATKSEPAAEPELQQQLVVIDLTLDDSDDEEVQMVREVKRARIKQEGSSQPVEAVAALRLRIQQVCNGFACSALSCVPGCSSIAVWSSSAQHSTDSMRPSYSLFH